MKEGVTNLYHTPLRVNYVIDSLKGVPNGIASLDGNGIIPTSQMPPLPVGITYAGLDADKSNPGNYPVTTPVVGDKYIATDSNS